jgi:hypothetical protein
MNVSDKVLNNGPVAFTLFFAVVSAIVSLGGVLFGVATIRAKIFSRQLGIGFIVLTAASFVLGFLSIPGGGGISMSWWWATTGTFGVVAYIVASRGSQSSFYGASACVDKLPEIRELSHLVPPVAGILTFLKYATRPYS